MSPESVFRPGAAVLITGGASGVGFAFAQSCRSHGMKLALVDSNAEYLTKAKDILDKATTDGETAIYQTDVSQPSQWQKLRTEIESKFGGIDLLMLNAGASFKPRKCKQSWEDADYFADTFATNIQGVVNGIATFLPLLQQKKTPTAIIVTGSKQGITNPPGAGNPAYNASKAAVKSLAEHLAHDVREPSSPSYSPNTSVHLLIPGWTWTSLMHSSGPEPSLDDKPAGAWLPSQVAEYAYRKIGEKAFYIVCPDNDVHEELDQARMAWGANDVTEGRPALSRWNEEWKDRAAKWIDEEAARRKN